MQLSADGSIACEFVRQRCTHDALFQPFYKRSNRTKGSKILRCFPHCCPNHAHRGFCGSSLHVRVQWSPPPADRSSGPPPKIYVYGRFRLADTALLPVGHRLSAGNVFQSLQSDDTPNGEWIEGQMIYSWSETNWLFEINNAARWFYGWESSTVKSQRLKDHVLDVYVMAPLLSSPHGPHPEVLQVVASTTSPAFQLISFRRATDDAMLALSATHHVRQQLQSGNTDIGPPPDYGHSGGGGGVGGGTERAAPAETRHQQQQPQKSPALAMLLPHGLPRFAPPSAPSPIGGAPPSLARAAPLPSLRPSFAISAPPPLDPRARQWTAPPLAVATGRPLVGVGVAASSPRDEWRPPPSSAQAFASVGVSHGGVERGRERAGGGDEGGGGGEEGAEKTVWELANLVGQLHQIPLGDTFERMGWMLETFAEYKTAYSASAPPPERRPGHDTGCADAEQSLRRALSVLQSASSTRKVSSRLLATLTELALWLFFDRATADALRQALHNAALSLLDTRQLCRHARRMAFWLHDHVNRFLHARFSTSIRELLRDCHALGFQLPFQFQARAGRLSSGGLTVEPSDAKGVRLTAMKGQDVFVAHVRELSVAIETSKRNVRPKLDHDKAVPAMAPSAAVRSAQLSNDTLQRQFNAQWSCSVDCITVRRARFAPTPPPPVLLSSSTAVSSSSSASAAAFTSSPNLSLLSLVWFWRQFSVLTLALSDGGGVLEATSLFQCISPLHSRFVLDGKDRFLHAFPSGEATLATGVGRYSFGDYVGQYSSAVGEIQLHLYSFLAPTQLASSSSSSATAEPHPASASISIEEIAYDACYCYHVRLIGTPAGTLVANVTVKRAQLDMATLRRVGYSSAHTLLEEMATWTLQQKLTAVRAFDDLYHVDLVYRPQHHE